MAGMDDPLQLRRELYSQNFEHLQIFCCPRGSPVCKNATSTTVPPDALRRNSHSLRPLALKAFAVRKAPRAQQEMVWPCPSSQRDRRSLCCAPWASLSPQSSGHSGQKPPGHRRLPCGRSSSPHPAWRVRWCAIAAPEPECFRYDSQGRPGLRRRSSAWPLRRLSSAWRISMLGLFVPPKQAPNIR
jgi:hypothetical protein